MTALAARRLWRRLDEFFIQFPFSKITCKLSNNFVCRRKKSTLKKIILREGEVGCHVGWLWLGGVRCPSAFVERGSLDRVLTSAQHVLHSVRVLHASHSPLPPPSLLSSGFVTTPPTFSPIKEIRDYNLHLNPQTVLDSHPFDWWSFSLSSSANVLFPVKSFSSSSRSILHSLSALSLSCLPTVTLSREGRVCPIQARGTSLADYPPFIPRLVTCSQ